VIERNSDLPIIDELGTEFQALMTTAYAAEGEPFGDRHTARRRAPLPAAPPARERGAQARRIGRRAAIMLVLICLVGGVAFAAFRGGDRSGGHAHTAPALLGRDPGGAWSFSVYRDEGRLCTVFGPRGGELSGNCGAAPRRGRLRAESAIAGGYRYVFGVSGAGVERVSATLGVMPHPRAPRDLGAGPDRPQSAREKVRAPVDPDAARDAGFPARNGWFVLDLGPVHGAGQSASPAVLTPLTRRGHRAGPSYVDCSLGVIAPACRRRIESAARG
jgi:hypothetical protein